MCKFISQTCVFQYAQICNMTYEQQICPCVLSPAKSSPMFDWGLPTALKYSKSTNFTNMWEKIGWHIMIVQTFNILIVPRAEDFPFEIFTSAQSGPKLLCVVIGNISQEDILDNLPPGNLKDEKFFFFFFVKICKYIFQITRHVTGGYIGQSTSSKFKRWNVFFMKCQNINLRQPNISQEDIFDNLPQGN